MAAKDVDVGKPVTHAPNNGFLLHGKGGVVWEIANHGFRGIVERIVNDGFSRNGLTDFNSFLFRNLVDLRSIRVSSTGGTKRVKARYTAGAYMTSG